MSIIQHYNQIHFFNRYTPFWLKTFCFPCFVSFFFFMHWSDMSLNLWCNSWSLQGKASVDYMHWWFWSVLHYPLQRVLPRCSFLWWVLIWFLRLLLAWYIQRNYMFKNLIVFLWLNIFEGLGKRETFALAKSGIDATFAEDEVKQQLGLIFDSASPEYV